jgi:hypothetical protein
MKLKRYKEFNEGIFSKVKSMFKPDSKVKSIFKSEFERYADKIDASLKEILKDLKSNFDIKLHKYDSDKYKSYIWDIQVVGKEDYVELFFVDNKSINLMDGMFRDLRIETWIWGDGDSHRHKTAYFDCSYLVKENQLDFQLKQIISMFIGTLEFIEKREIFDQEYPLEDIKNWTYGLSDMDGLNLKLYKLGPNFINDKDGWTKAGKPGYLSKVWIEKTSDEWKSFEEDFKNEIEMLKKQLSNVGLNLKVNGGTTQHKGEIVLHEQTFVIQKL